MQCIVRPCQSGKTRTMQEKIREMERLIHDREMDGDGYLNILITSNNRSLVSQTQARMMNDLYSPASADSDDSTDGESMEPSDDKIEGSVFSWMSGTKTRTEVGALADRVKELEVRMIVCCAHKTRIGYVISLLRNLEKSRRYDQRINIWFDEADAYIKLLTNPELDMCVFSRVEKVWLVSATFHSVVDYYGSIRVEPAEKSHPDCYVKIADCEIVVDDVCAKNAVEYITHVVNTRPELAVKGMRLYTPGDRERKSHTEIANFLISKGFAVAILNGARKCVLVPSGEDEPIVHNIVDYATPAPESVGDTLARMYVQLGLNAYPYAITGQICLGRGLTFCSDDEKYPFLFDEEIVPDIKSEADRYQCTARGVGNIGNFRSFKAPRITMSSMMRESVLQSEAIAVRLAPFALEKGIVNIGRAEMAYAVHGDEDLYNRQLDEAAAGARTSHDDENYAVLWSEEFTSLASLSASKLAGKKLPAPRDDGFYKDQTGGKKPMSRTKLTALKSGKKTAQMRGALEVGEASKRTFPFYEDPADPSTLRFVVRTLTRLA